MLADILFQLLQSLLDLCLLLEVDRDELIESNRALTVNVDLVEDVFGVFSVHSALCLHVQEVKQLFESNRVVVVSIDTLELRFQTVENSLVFSFNFDILSCSSDISSELLLKRLPGVLNFLRVIIVATICS
jgi:hypothetical protein